jgi:hypothetical protein
MTPDQSQQTARPKHIDLIYQECAINMNNAAVMLQAKEPTPAELTLWTIACLLLETFREKWGLPEPNTDAPAADSKPETAGAGTRPGNG